MKQLKQIKHLKKDQDLPIDTIPEETLLAIRQVKKNKADG